MTSIVGRNELRRLPWLAWKPPVANQIFQITDGITHNPGLIGINTTTTSSLRNLFHAKPIKGYRREIASATHLGNNGHSSNRRISSTIDGLNRPGGSICVPAINSATFETLYQNNGVGCQTVDIHRTVNQTERPSLVGSAHCITDPATNARRRCRSAGMVQPKLAAGHNTLFDATFNMTTQEYLHSRQRTFAQNQGIHIRRGDSTVRPGTLAALPNIYAPDGVNRCPLVLVSAAQNNHQFDYQWVNGATYTVTLPDGEYTVEKLNEAFATILYSNKHYLMDTLNHNVAEHVFRFVYDLVESRIQLQTKPIATYNFSLSQYSVPANADWVFPQRGVCPRVIIRSFATNGFGTLVGMTAGSYPVQDIQVYVPGTGGYTTQFNSPFAYQNGTPTTIPSSNQTTTGTSSNTYALSASVVNQVVAFQGMLKPVLYTHFVPLWYKPSNPKFATQGAVSASSQLVRLRYNTITTSGSKYKTPFASTVVSQTAYTKSYQPGYFLKERVGYQTKCSPFVTSAGSVSCDKFARDPAFANVIMTR